jgi:hypothetical protein
MAKKFEHDAKKRCYCPNIEGKTKIRRRKKYPSSK